MTKPYEYTYAPSKQTLERDPCWATVTISAELIEFDRSADRLRNTLRALRLVWRVTLTRGNEHLHLGDVECRTDAPMSADDAVDEVRHRLDCALSGASEAFLAQSHSDELLRRGWASCTKS